MSVHAWFLTDSALDRLVRDAPGLPVTEGYNKDRVLGKVLAAERCNGGATVTVEVDRLPPGIAQDAFRLAPALSNPDAKPNPGAGVVPLDDGWQAEQFTIVPPELAIMLEVLLDTVSGLPLVQASRTDDGQLTFRLITVRPGGMVVAQPVTESVMRDVQRKSSERLADRVAVAAVAAAAGLENADRAQRQRVADLEGQVAELEGQLVAERAENAKLAGEKPRSKAAA